MKALRSVKDSLTHGVERSVKVQPIAHPLSFEEIVTTLQQSSGLKDMTEYCQMNRMIWQLQTTGFMERRELLKAICDLQGCNRTVLQSMWLAEVCESKIGGESWQARFWVMQATWMIMLRGIDLKRLHTITEFLSISPNNQHDIFLQSILRRLCKSQPTPEGREILSHLLPASEEAEELFVAARKHLQVQPDHQATTKINGNRILTWEELVQLTKNSHQYESQIVASLVAKQTATNSFEEMLSASKIYRAGTPAIQETVLGIISPYQFLLLGQ